MHYGPHSMDATQKIQVIYTQENPDFKDQWETFKEWTGPCLLLYRDFLLWDSFSSMQSTTYYTGMCRSSSLTMWTHHYCVDKCLVAGIRGCSSASVRSCSHAAYISHQASLLSSENSKVISRLLLPQRNTYCWVQRWISICVYQAC